MVQFLSYIMLLIYTLTATFSASYAPYKQKEYDANLTVAMMSDIHIDQKELLVQGNFRRGMANLKNIDGLDAFLMNGDIANYGDTKSISLFYDIFKKSSPVSELVVAYGNHDIGHTHDLGMTSDEARQRNIELYNKYTGENIENIYYSKEINGYKFIVLCDEGDHWDGLTISNKQLEFLDRELADGTKDGKPVFICCHWPMDGKNGEDTVSFHQDGTFYDENDNEGFQDQVKEVLKKYKNVFWISGHMHKGQDDSFFGESLNFRWAETDEDGVTYVNLPTYGLVNIYGVFWWGAGSVMEVYDNSVTFRAVNFRMNKELVSSTMSFDLK